MVSDYTTAWRAKFRSIYSSDLGHDIVNEFLIPSLEPAVDYSRITGDFSSAFLVAAARGIGPFFLRDGRMRLVTNGRFTEDDLAAMEGGFSLGETVERSLLREIDLTKDIISEFERDHLAALVWLLKTGRLEIRVSLLKDVAGRPLPASNPMGEQHSKVGIIRTTRDETIAFIGGLNESMRAYLGNAESLQAKYSWNPEALTDIQTIERIFDTLWENHSPKTVVLTLPDACKRKLIETYETPDMPDLSKWLKKTPPPAPRQPSWAHQEKAIQAFLDAKHGVLEMATGTGKTRTALRIADKLLSEGKIRGIIVVTKENDLLDQWYRELIAFFGPSRLPILRHYGGSREIDVFLEVLGTRPSVLLTSYMNLSTLIGRNSRDLLNDCLLVCDEVHNIGSAGNVKALRGRLGIFEWCVGLSATSERPYDPEGNRFIEEDIGPVVFKFGLEDAIRKGILCEFDYVPLFYELDQDDKDRLRAVYARFNARKESGDPMPLEELYQELARVRKLSKAKLPVFEEYLRSHPGTLNRCLIFVEEKEYGHLAQAIILHTNADYHTYYGDDETENLELFSKGGLGCLITCRRIAEGVDVRSLSNIVLFACSRARLETIQRMGRALRTDPANPAKRANIVDFIRGDDLSQKAEEPETEPVDRERYSWLSDLSKVRREAGGET